MSYPNMSYCMCENTLLAMRQIITAMQNEGTEFLQDMSRSERQSFAELFNACESFLTMSEELVDSEEEQEISPWVDE